MKRALAVLLCLMLCLTVQVAGAATKGEENALATAISYLDYTHFSWQGLYNQLTFEGYSPEECRYAVDNCGADWFDQAAGCANDYLEYTSFSRKSLKDQLIYEGFTREEAEYGTAAAYGENPVKPAGTQGQETISSAASAEKKAPAATAAEKEVPAAADEKGTSDTAAAAGNETLVVESSAVLPSGEDADLSALSYEDLILIRQQITKEIMSRPEWKEVEVPAGTWIVGQDIPAGSYSISTDGYVTFKYYADTETDYYDYYIIENSNPLGKTELKDGMRVELNGTVTFTPPRALGF